jgi:hypothetical protein
MIGDALSAAVAVAKRPIFNFRKMENPVEGAERLFVHRSRRGTEATFLHSTLFCALLFPGRIACMRLCRELQAGRPSRHRHLRRGADLKNRALPAPRECTWDGVSAATPSEDGPASKL